MKLCVQAIVKTGRIDDARTILQEEQARRRGVHADGNADGLGSPWGGPLGGNSVGLLRGMPSVGSCPFGHKQVPSPGCSCGVYFCRYLGDLLAWWEFRLVSKLGHPVALSRIRANAPILPAAPFLARWDPPGSMRAQSLEAVEPLYTLAKWSGHIHSMGLAVEVVRDWSDLLALEEAPLDERTALPAFGDPIPDPAALIGAIRERSTSRGSLIHGEDHWWRVARMGIQLAEQTPGASSPVAFAFGWVHDAMRRHDGHDPDHGGRGAVLAFDLATEGLLELPPTDLELLRSACAEHSKGTTTADPTIGVCWDADRLDLRRLGVEPRADLLSTEAGSQVRAPHPTPTLNGRPGASWGPYSGEHTFGCV